MVIAGLIGLAKRTRNEEEGWKRAKVIDALGKTTKNASLKHPEINSILVELLQDEKDDIFQGTYYS